MYPLVASIKTMDAISSGLPNLPMGILLCHGRKQHELFADRTHASRELTLTASDGFAIISVSAGWIVSSGTLTVSVGTAWRTFDQRRCDAICQLWCVHSVDIPRDFGTKLYSRCPPCNSAGTANGSIHALPTSTRRTAVLSHRQSLQQR